ncbi:deoxyribodipyrimidine photo-lyase [Staphylococcus warneri]|uniref:cryptochrome/photolyase family protein n=1 Tax=Staphylococcus TaxID=1279 RepID=UPI0006407FC3|nr:MULTISPECIES: deoxyribodipyrimidine photo-lyase [Staphylococcus]MCG7306704.1 DNA photolyase family protein [Staphylococcus warneri]PNN64788.1 deoxyribodipyrimidine photo-lyase [Staphylococcus sp. FDAARGOS_39]
MKVGVILNRVFRIHHNPLLAYICNQLGSTDTCVLIIPKEKFGDEAQLKASFYHGTLNAFINTLNHYQIQTNVMDYNHLIAFCKNQQLDKVVMASDIMSYHHESYDYPHQKQRFQEAGIKVEALRVQHYFSPRKTFNNQGEPYKVFTSFYKKWRPYVIERHRAHYELSDISKIVEPAYAPTQINDSHSGLTEKEVQQQWQSFLNNDIQNYESNREYLPEVLTSQLSIALAYGLIDILQVFNDLLHGYESNESNYEAFIRELIFREFYYVLMTQYPETAHQSFKEKYRNIEWVNDKQQFDQWKNGKTGYPIVDAAMQELNQTGYMHNRMRMVTSQFLTKDLLIDWTWGETYFKDKLIDYDNASNVHGWQWSALTGTDAVPYFRMFNPIKQSERFDPNALYIKQWLSTLNHVDSHLLHDTQKHMQLLKQQGIQLGVDYPEPMVNHQYSRQRVMSLFKSL